MKLWINPVFWGALLWVLTSCACSDGKPPRDAGIDGDGQIEQDADGFPADGDDVAADEAADGDPGPVVLDIQAVLPSRGPVEGGTWANIIGSGFVRGIDDSPFDVRDVTDVTFADNPAIDIEIIRDDMISVRTPAGLPGPTSVTVENPNGRVTLEGAFTYFETVTAYGLAPTDFSSRGGTGFSVQGTGLTGDTTVLVRGQPASSVVVEDATRVSALAPPGNPGPADVEVVNRNGRALLFRAATYHPVPELFEISPAAGPQAGQTAVAASGQGFNQLQELLFGQSPAPDFQVGGPGSAQAVTPAGPGVPGPVDVTLRGPVDQSVLSGGFVYLPDTTGLLTISGVAPDSGPLQGGQTATVAGEGFASGVDAVTFGTAPATDLQVLSDRMIQLSVPPGQPGPAAVAVQTPAGQTSLDEAYRYYQPVTLNGIDPGSGPAQGGTPFVLGGSGFHDGVQVLFGGVPAESLQVLGEDQISGVTPPNLPAAVDLMAFDQDSQAVLEDAFRYTTDLSLLRVDPDFGSMAGGTYVTCYGEGFGPDMVVKFGEVPGTIIQVISPSVFTARSPRGDPGEVAVTVERGGESHRLERGFSYIDTTNGRGGATGGPIQGAFNVTTLDGSYSTYGAPLPDVTVVLAEPAISGITDDRGQVTFSGPSIVRAVTVTMAREGFSAVTVANLNAANLTVYMYPNEREPVDVNPQPVNLGAVSGRVFGFKDIPGLPTGPTISFQAQVMFTSWSIYSVPPYGGIPRGLPIENDGDLYRWESLRFGNYSLYALFGAYDSATDTFTPALLGLRRSIPIVSEEELTDQDIVLGTYLDQSVAVHLQDPPLGVGGVEATYGAYVSLDLGRDGVIYLAQATGPGTELTLSGLPEAASDSFIFTGIARPEGIDPYPLSYTFRRQEGDLGDGVTLGPFLGFTEILQPQEEGELIGGRISWAVQDPQPELIQVLIETNELLPVTLWRVILPGDATEITLPAELLNVLPQGEPLILRIFTANSPRFTFDRFNYSQLGTGRWTSYTLNVISFNAP